MVFCKQLCAAELKQSDEKSFIIHDQAAAYARRIGCCFLLINLT